MTENKIHRTILKDAWEVVWKNKRLWLLGFFAAFWGNAGVFKIFNSLIDSFGQTREARLGFWQAAQNAPKINDWLSPWAIIFFILSVAIIGWLIWAATASRGGLIKAVSEAKSDGKSACREALTHGTEKFWPILLLSLFGKIITGFLLIGLAALLLKFSFGSPWWLFPFYILGFVLLAGLVIIISFIIIYALAFVMINGFGFWKSLSRAIDIFIKNWLISAELAVIIYTLSFLLGLALVIAALILAMPLLLALVILIFLGAPTVFWLVAIPAAVVFFLIFLTAGAAFTTFELTAWVLLFKRLTQGGAVAKLVRLFSRKEK